VTKRLDQVVAPEDASRLMAFIDRVCRGDAGTIEYDLVDADGTRRTLETHAVPLQRESIGCAVYLSATWDVSARKRAEISLAELQARSELDKALYSSERKGFEEALNDAKAAHGERAHTWRLERQKLEAAVRDAEERGKKLFVELNGECERLKAALSQVTGQHETQAREWGAERDALTADLQHLRDQGRLAELALERSHQEHQATLAVEQERHQTTLTDLRTLTDRQLEDSRAECDRLNEQVRELQHHELQLAAQREAERVHFNSALEAERARCQLLRGEYDQLRAELALIVRSAHGMTAIVERVLNRPLTDSECEHDASGDQPALDVSLEGEESAVLPAEDSPWGF